MYPLNIFGYDQIIISKNRIAIRGFILWSSYWSAMMMCENNRIMYNTSNVYKWNLIGKFDMSEYLSLKRQNSKKLRTESIIELSTIRIMIWRHRPNWYMKVRLESCLSNFIDTIVNMT